jgi:hypothetical protein
MLAGAADRASAMIRSSLAEPVEVEIKTFYTKDDPESGYLVIIVPASPRAPHMVIVKNENRFYGRIAKGNIPLTEGEVARLYQRRKEWESDREQLLDEFIEEVDRPPHADFGYLFIFARRLLPPLRGWMNSTRETFRHKEYTRWFIKRESLQFSRQISLLSSELGNSRRPRLGGRWIV